MKKKNEKVIFDLRCAPGVTPEQHYLVLIEFLTTELRKYTEVEIINEEILDKFKQFNRNQAYNELLSHCVDMANLEGIATMPEYFMKHPPEETNLPEEKLEEFKQYLRDTGCIA